MTTSNSSTFSNSSTLNLITNAVKGFGYKIMFKEEIPCSVRGTASVGKCYPTKKEVWIKKSLEPKKALEIVLHEVGHALCGHGEMSLPHGTKEWEAEIFCERVLTYLELPSQGDKYRLRYEPGEIRFSVIEQAVIKFVQLLKAEQSKPKLMGPPKRMVA
jgi:hypothetical protein